MWYLGSASARDVHDRVGAPHGLVYTTTAKVLDRLFAKKLVARERVGKSFLYRPLVERHVIERARARNALKTLLGSEPLPAIAALVDVVSDIDPELLDELARTVNARRRSRRGT
jgi:predicted transcriptional regulator